MLMKSTVIGIVAGSVLVGLISLMLLRERNSDNKRVESAARNHQVKIDHIGGTLDNGLHYVTIDDSVKVLIYQRYEGVSMIQVK
jgi:hypothetical protein